MEQLFTVLICTYNGSKRISGVLDRILLQEGLDELVKKIVVIDNNSTDNTSEIVQRYIKINSKIHYFFEAKQGLSYARLAGLKCTDTKWIIFLDDDNYLKDGWILGAYKYILDNPQIGVFNGKIIAKPDFRATKEELETLFMVRRALACTHVESMHKDFSIDENKWKPVGAGMVIKTEPLMEFSKLGWMTSEGRKGESVISGEDTEMVNYLVSVGYQTGFCSNIELEHLIGRHRISKEYLIKLYKSFIESSYRIHSSQKYYIVWRLAHLVNAVFVIAKVTIKAGCHLELKQILIIEQQKVHFEQLKKNWLFKR